jgi:RecA-family ATPase
MARVEATKALPLVSFEDIMREPLAPVEWLVDGIVAPGDRVMVYGEFGAFKSWLLLHLGLHIAAGVRWLGRFNVPTPRRVLYIDEEMHEQTWRRRVQKLAVGAGLDTRACPSVFCPALACG